MIKIITALGNPNLNSELKKYNEFCVLENDIVYFDGIIEILEKNKNTDYLIVSDIIAEENNVDDLIEKIIKINRRIKLIAIINKKNKILENKLLEKGILDIFYDDENIIDIINFLKTKNIEYLNVELREEINNLKNILIEKNNKKNSLFVNNIVKNNCCKVIGVTGARGIGKTTFCKIFAEANKKNNKILIVDFDFINANIGDLYNKKIEYSKINELNFKNYIVKINENIDILIGLNFLYYYNKFDFSKIKNEINELKKIYNYIICDTYTERLFDNNKLIYEIFDEVFLLSGSNKIDLIKTNILINLMKKWNINKNKIKLIYYKISLFDSLKIYFKNDIQEINLIRKNNK